MEEIIHHIRLINNASYTQSNDRLNSNTYLLQLQTQNPFSHDQLIQFLSQSLALQDLTEKIACCFYIVGLLEAKGIGLGLYEKDVLDYILNCQEKVLVHKLLHLLIYSSLIKSEDTMKNHLLLLSQNPKIFLQYLSMIPKEYENILKHKNWKISKREEIVNKFEEIHKTILSFFDSNEVTVLEECLTFYKEWINFHLPFDHLPQILDKIYPLFLNIPNLRLSICELWSLIVKHQNASKYQNSIGTYFFNLIISHDFSSILEQLFSQNDFLLYPICHFIILLTRELLEYLLQLQNLEPVQFILKVLSRITHYEIPFNVDNSDDWIEEFEKVMELHLDVFDIWESLQEIYFEDIETTFAPMKELIMKQYQEILIILKSQIQIKNSDCLQKIQSDSEFLKKWKNWRRSSADCLMICLSVLGQDALNNDLISDLNLCITNNDWLRMEANFFILQPVIGKTSDIVLIETLYQLLMTVFERVNIFQTLLIKERVIQSALGLLKAIMNPRHQLIILLQPSLNTLFQFTSYPKDNIQLQTYKIISSIISDYGEHTIFCMNDLLQLSPNDLEKLIYWMDSISQLLKFLPIEGKRKVIEWFCGEWAGKISDRHLIIKALPILLNGLIGNNNATSALENEILIISIYELVVRNLFQHYDLNRQILFRNASMTADYCSLVDPFLTVIRQSHSNEVKNFSLIFWQECIEQWFRKWIKESISSQADVTHIFLEVHTQFIETYTEKIRTTPNGQEPVQTLLNQNINFLLSILLPFDLLQMSNINILQEMGNRLDDYPELSESIFAFLTSLLTGHSFLLFSNDYLIPLCILLLGLFRSLDRHIFQSGVQFYISLLQQSKTKNHINDFINAFGREMILELINWLFIRKDQDLSPALELLYKFIQEGNQNTNHWLRQALGLSSSQTLNAPKDAKSYYLLVQQEQESIQSVLLENKILKRDYYQVNKSLRKWESVEEEDKENVYYESIREYENQIKRWVLLKHFGRFKEQVGDWLKGFQ